MNHRMISKPSITLSLVLAGLPSLLHAGTPISNGFEFDTGGWSGFGGTAAAPERVVTGTGGVVSREDNAHAIAKANSYTQWGGYRSAFPASGYTTSIDIYLDPTAAYTDNTRFDFSSAVNGTNGNHRRDFVFNAAFHNTGAAGSRFAISASTGSSALSPSPETVLGHVLVTDKGWYTLEHVFSKVGDALQVVLNLKNTSGAILGTWTLSDPSDKIGEEGVVGGNRYGWFSVNQFPGGLPIDNSSITFLGSEEGPIRNINRNTSHFTIASAAGEASAGNVIEVSPGVYPENVVASKPLTIKGVGAGVTISPASGVGVTLSDGTSTTFSGLENLTVQGSSATLTGVSVGSFTKLTSVVSTGHSASGIYLRGGARIEIVNATSSHNGVGIHLNPLEELDNLRITGGVYESNRIGWEFSAGNGTVEPQLTDVRATGALIKDNKVKGVYAERLSDAFLENLTVTGNGTNGTDYPGTGVELNLKWSDFSRITIRSCVFSGNGVSNETDSYDPQGALAIKARNDGWYAANPATLSKVRIKNNIFTGNGRSLTVGEPGGNNATPGELSIEGNRFSGAQDKELINSTVSSITASMNYWDTPLRPVNKVQGNVQTLPYYKENDFSVAGPVRNTIAPAVGYATIQGAVDSSTTLEGHTVEVDAGTYEESVKLNKDGIKLLSTDGNTATRIVPPTPQGNAVGTVVFTPGTDGAQLGDEGKGFEIHGFDGPLPGIETAAVYFEGAHAGAKVSGNKIIADGDSAFLTEYGAVNADFDVSHNEFAGQTFTGSTPGGIYGVDSQYAVANYPRILVVVNGNKVANFSFTNNNITGIAGASGHGATLVYFNDSIAGLTIKDNNFGGSTGGVGVTPRSTLVVDGTDVVIEDNVFTANAPAGLTAYSTLASLKRNSFKVYPSTTIAAKGTFTIDASGNYWGDVNGPTGNLTKLQSGGAPIAFSPWFSVSNGSPAPDLLLSDPRETVVPNNIDNITIDYPETYTDLYIAPNQKVTVVKPGSITAGKVEIADGGELVVEDAGLTLGEDSKISGTFTIFNSFGSWNINGSTTFEIGTSLALISDIHVASGAELTVNGGGELILDGCVVESQSSQTATPIPFKINVEEDGLLTIARSLVKDAEIDINTLTTEVPANLRSSIYDSDFTRSKIEASGSSKVYHNLFDSGTETNSNGDGTVAFDAVDGWANVTNAADLKPSLSLDFAGEPIGTGPTRDDDGNLFVKPGDAVNATLSVKALGSNSIQAVEALAGFNSSYLGSMSITPNNPLPSVPPSVETRWQTIITTPGSDGALGWVDSAIGVIFEASNPDGSNRDSTIADFDFTALDAGKTQVFFRVQTNREFDGTGKLLKDTRLTKSAGGSPSHLSAFTVNTGILIIDETKPVVNQNVVTQVTATQSQNSGSVNVLDNAAPVFRGTPITVTFGAIDAVPAAPDQLAVSGVDGADHANDLLVFSGPTLLAPTSVVPVTLNSGEVQYTVTLDVPANSPAGTYPLSAQVRDRAGNLSELASLGSFTLLNEIRVAVELEGFLVDNATMPTTRAVTFVATGPSISPEVWTETVEFTTSTPTGSIGTVTLPDVPPGTTALSAKTNWSLRSRVDIAFDAGGIASAALTNGKKLRGGDFNGDNVVNTLDYGIMNYYWLSTVSNVADITGNGSINTIDFNVLSQNFYKLGDLE